MDLEVVRLHSSMTRISCQVRVEKQERRPRFAVGKDTSAWERVKTAAKRNANVSQEPAKCDALRLRVRRKDLELHPPMRFPSPAPTRTTSTFSLRSEESPVKTHPRKHSQHAKPPPTQHSKRHLQALLSLKLGYSTGGSDLTPGFLTPRKRQSLLAQLPSHRRWRSLQGVS